MLTDSVSPISVDGREVGASHSRVRGRDRSRRRRAGSRAAPRRRVAEPDAYDGPCSATASRSTSCRFPGETAACARDQSRHAPARCRRDRARLSRQLPLGAFGDVTMRTDYVDWTIQPSGRVLADADEGQLNGEPLRDITLASGRLDAAAPRRPIRSRLRFGAHAVRRAIRSSTSRASASARAASRRSSRRASFACPISGR